MRCFVYRSHRREHTYVYLARADDFDCLPEPLRRALGPLHRVLEVDLDRQRLAREDPAVVRANLQSCGFHVQYPPLEWNRHER